MRKKICATFGQFPACVNEILAQISAFIKQHGQKWARKLKLMGMLCTFFAQEELRTNRLERHMLFEWTVMALQYPVYPLFEDIAQWLYKVGSGKTYADRVVGELLDKFILIPEKHRMYEYVIPLRAHALPFALFFLVHSLNEQSMCVPLVIVLSQWISTNCKGFMDLFREHNQLSEKFATQKFDLLLQYDNENKRREEVDDRLHYSVTCLLVEWSSCCQHKLKCDSIITILPKFAQLPAIGQQRVADNVENALRMGYISLEAVQPNLTEEFFRLSDFSTRFDGLLEQE
uniref:Uncharacterized protein n=1 Tax=Ditylenchus dipsaci TaxID=166011 RepID=A0A915DVI9_9BILA